MSSTKGFGADDPDPDYSDEDDEDEFSEEDAAVHKIEFWQITAHVHGKLINISVGDGTQRIKWVAAVAIARWDEETNQGWRRLGIPVSVKAKSTGEQVDMVSIIRETLMNGDHIVVETSLAPNETK
jgi:hypothetical protein